METIRQEDTHSLEHDFHLQHVAGKSCLMMIRDGNQELQGRIEVCNGKVSNLSGVHEKPLTDETRRIMEKYVKDNKFTMLPSAARKLGLSIYKKNDGIEEYLNADELAEKLKEPLDGVTLIINNFKKRRFEIKPCTTGAVLDFSRARIRHIKIGADCHLLMDLRDNAYVKSLKIGSNFSGRMNLSRTGLRSVHVGSNCHCDFNVNDSLKCFNMEIGDIFSGAINIRNSCFHKLKIGFYCYAAVNLKDNWGRKYIELGSSFRGSLNVDTVKIPEIKIGDDCRGTISVSSRDNTHGAQTLDVADDFSGNLDIGSSQTIRNVRFGIAAKGKINMRGCPSVKTVKFEEKFSGTADFSDSAVEYIRTGAGSRGKMILFNCDNLTLVKIPQKNNIKLSTERKALKVKKEKESIYYSFNDKELPSEYFTPFYKEWYIGLKKFAKRWFQ